jgi:electron transfer flavoprotein beta subunit
VHVIVCVKQIPNPEAPASAFEIAAEAKKVVVGEGMTLVMSPYDEQAIEAALRIRDTLGEVRITMISLGSDSVRGVLKHGFSLGADAGVLLCDPAFEEADSYTTALALATAIKKIGAYDLILTGRQAADWDMGVVGAGIAELLGVPVITLAKDVQVHDGTVQVERVLQDGFETVEASLPAVVTVSNELGAPRTPNLRQVMRAARQKPTVWSAADVGLEANQVGVTGARLRLEQLLIPVREGRCEFIEGNAPQELAANLVRRLQEVKVLS